MGKIYDSEYGTNVVGRYEDGKIYDSEYGSNVIGHYESGKIYGNLYQYLFDRNSVCCCLKISE